MNILWNVDTDIGVSEHHAFRQSCSISKGKLKKMWKCFVFPVELTGGTAGMRKYERILLDVDLEKCSTLVKFNVPKSNFRFIINIVKFTSTLSLNRSPESWSICWKQTNPSCGGPSRITWRTEGHIWATFWSISAIGATPNIVVAPTDVNWRTISSEIIKTEIRR